MKKIFGTLFWAMSRVGFFNATDDEIYLKRLYKYRMGYSPDLINPTKLNEKIQWLKINDKNKKYTDLVDKFAVKTIVAEMIGEEYVIPTLYTWDNVEDICWEKLPKQFVLKVTHDSGGLIVCKNKELLDTDFAIKKLTKALKSDYYKLYREWPYKDVKRRIICEPYLEDSVTGELRDYKFFCFNGKPEIMFIASDRQKKGEEVKFDFFDMEFNWLNIKNGHPNALIHPSKPLGFEKMKTLASILSKDIPFVRVDFYDVNGKVFFGEMTFYHFSGLTPFEPDSWDLELGGKLKLPEVYRNE